MMSDIKPLTTKINKLQYHTQALKAFERDQVYTPLTIQVAPTEVCQSRCTFCSYINRNKSASLDFDVIIDALRKFKILGAKSVEFTGGGNPLLYICKKTKKNINDLILATSNLGFSIGLITNSLDLKVLSERSASLIEWVRISGIGLYEGKRPADINLGHIRQNDLSFMFVYNGPHISDKSKSNVTSEQIIGDAKLVLDMYPYIKQVRISPDVNLTGSEKSEIFSKMSRALDVKVSKIVFDGFAEDETQKPSSAGCIIGGFKPLLASSPEYDGVGCVYICCCFSHFSNKKYSRKYVLCNSNDIIEKWGEMSLKSKKKLNPYELNTDGSKEWNLNCLFCIHSKTNDMLGAIANGRYEVPDNFEYPENMNFI